MTVYSNSIIFCCSSILRLAACLFLFSGGTTSVDGYFKSCHACQDKCNYAGYLYGKMSYLYYCSCKNGSYLGSDKRSCFGK